MVTLNYVVTIYTVVTWVLALFSSPSHLFIKQLLHNTVTESRASHKRTELYLNLLFFVSVTFT